MAAISASIARGASESDLGQSGAGSVTFGTNAPAAGDVEIRFSSAALAAGMTTKEIKILADIIWRVIVDSYVTTGTAQWPNL